MAITYPRVTLSTQGPVSSVPKDLDRKKILKNSKLENMPPE